MLAPNQAAKDRCAPREILSCDGQRKKSGCSGRCNEAQQSEKGGNEDTAPDRAKGDISQRLGNRAKETRERKCAVTGKCPSLSACCDENGKAHEELHNEHQGHETERAVFADGVKVDLCHGLTKWSAEDGFEIGVDASCENDHNDPS